MGYLENDPTAPKQQSGSLLDRIMKLRAAQSEAGVMADNPNALPVSTEMEVASEPAPARTDNWSVKDTPMTTSPGISRKPMRSAVIREFGEGNFKKWDSMAQAWKPVETFRMKSEADEVDQMYWWDEGTQMFYPFIMNSEI